MPLPTSRASTKSQPVDPTASRHDLPLSHTWHGGANHRSTPYQAGGGDSGAFGSSVGGSRANLSRSSKVWGTGRGPRIEQDGREWTTPSNALEEAAAAATGTPTKSVKFALGRKKNEIGLSPWGTLADGGAGAGVASDASAISRGAAGGDRTQAGDKNRAVEEVTDKRAAVMNVIVQARFWADYFNNTLRCWEALLDPFR